MTEEAPPRATPSSDVPPASAPHKKPRNVAELVIVRGGIAALLLLVAWQGVARYGYSQTVEPLTAAMRAADESEQSVTEADVRRMLQGFSNWAECPVDPATKESRAEKFTWVGPFKSYSLIVCYGVEGRSEAETIVLRTDTP